VRVRHVESLPLVLTREEVAAVLVQPQRHFFRVLFRLTYHCGMRLGEVIRLAPCDLDEAAGRIHIRFAKGGKPRYVPATPEMFAEVRRFYLRHNNPLWLFPGLGQGWKHLKITREQACARSKTHVSEAAVQNAFKLCVQESGIGKPAHLHTLRHCYATHLLEEGVSIRLISQYMGHASLNPTIIYTHLTAVSEEQTREALARLYTQSHSK
jgi:integrase